MQSYSSQPGNPNLAAVTSTASSFIKQASVEASPVERNSIMAMKIFGWIDLALSVLVALGFCALTVLGARALGSYSSGLAGLQMLMGLLVGAIIALQGGFVWAVCQVGASMAESLIMIRKNTA